MIYIELPDFQEKIYYLGLPYIVESMYRQRMFGVLDYFEGNINVQLEGKILNKYFKMKQVKSHAS